MPGGFNSHIRFSYPIFNENTFWYQWKNNKVDPGFIPTSVPIGIFPIVNSTPKLQAAC